MNKGVLVGGGLGFLVLAFLGGYWLANTASTPDATAGGQGQPASAINSGRPLAPGTPGASSSAGARTADGMTPSASVPWANGAVAPAAPVSPDAGVTIAPESALSREERRKIRERVRAKLAELQAMGPNVQISQVQALMDEVESLGKGEFDPRYFQTMRLMLENTARVQTLGKELQAIASSSAAKDVTRRQAILVEMRNLSDQITQSAAAVQSYARATAAAAQGKQP